MKNTEKIVDNLLTLLLVYAVLSVFYHIYALGLGFWLGEDFLKNGEVYKAVSNPWNRFYFENMRWFALVEFIFSVFFMATVMLLLKRWPNAYYWFVWSLFVSVLWRFTDVVWIFYDFCFDRSGKMYFEEMRSYWYVDFSFYLTFFWSLILGGMFFWVWVYFRKKDVRKIFG